MSKDDFPGVYLLDSNTKESCPIDFPEYFGGNI